MHNFFERQDNARRRTGWLVALFAGAVVAIVGAVYVAVVAAVGSQTGGFDPIRPGLAVVVTVGVLGLVGTGSLYKTLSLRRGGAAVAELLGGRPLTPQPASVDERRLRNVVEEMALAAGVPVPAVYVLEEDGINAFAAGHTPDDAVVGVTRGCIQRLSRDELQGVVAHEFSHILNGDMRLNIRLMGLLHGILLLAIVGRVALQSGAHVRVSRDDRGRFPFLVIGLSLLVIGGIGVFFGRLIKAAVSRQREFLADAAAVQFTRNPDGLAGALKKIWAHSAHGHIQNAHAEEAGHLFFADGVEASFLSGRLFATHPPLEERIERLDPSFDRDAPDVPADAWASEDDDRRGADDRDAAGAMGLAGASSTGNRRVPKPEEAVRTAGTVTDAHVAAAHALHGRLPETLRDAVHDVSGAVAVVYALLLETEPEVRKQQHEILTARETAGVVAETDRLADTIAQVSRDERLALLDLAAPALRGMAPSQTERFLETVRRMAEADARVSLFEYALQVILRHRLEHAANPGTSTRRIQQLAEVRSEVRLVLSAIAQAGHANPDAATRALRAGAARLDDGSLSAVDLAQVRPAALNDALDRLARTASRLRERIVDACAHTALADDAVTPAEHDLLRALSIALHVPMPVGIIE